MTARKLAFEAILKTIKNKSYSNLVLDALLRENKLDIKEKQFASRLFYGVLERKLTLDYQIEMLSLKKINKLDAEVIAALEMGIYQLCYMESVPDSAAINESVNLIKNSKKKSASGFVNGVLRSFLRNGKKILLPQGDKYKKAEIEFSIPSWILKMWEKDYDFETALSLSESFIGEKPLNIRVNTKKISSDELLNEFLKTGVKAKKHEFVPDAITVTNSGDIRKLYGFFKGYFYVQDLSSQLCAHALEPKEGETVLDLCAAPGSKSFTLAQLTNDKAKIFSFDLHSHRVKLIEDGAKRLCFNSVTALKGDATVFNEKFSGADRVLCDVPCSGLGIIGRKPEIKYKTYDEIKALKDIQLSIINNGAKYLKKGGVLLYSTCALNKAENEEIIKEFLENNPDFEEDSLPPLFDNIVSGGVKKITLSPLLGDFDGFFIARLKRK